MRKRKNRSRQFNSFVLFGLFLTLILILIVSTVGQREFNAPHKFALEIIGSVQSGVSRVFLSIKGGWRGYVTLWDVRDENERLHEQLHQAKMDLVRYREAVATNVRLEKLLGLKKKLPSPTIAAQVIGHDPSQWFNTLIINQGGSDGVQQSMSVVNEDGVVGQVRNVSPHYAKVLLATDPNSAIDALIQESRVQGIIKGNGKGFAFHYVVKNKEVREGDMVVTSGMSGHFPKGQPVGVVSKVVRNRRGMFQQIEVEPVVDFDRLEHLVVILNEESLAEE